AGCLAYLLSGIGAETRQKDDVCMRPEEKDVTLTCAGSPCAAVPVVHEYDAGRSHGAFWAAFAAEALGTSALTNSSTPWALTLGFVGVIDLVAYISGFSKFGKQPGTGRIDVPVLATQGGTTVQLAFTDLVKPGQQDIPPTFSA